MEKESMKRHNHNDIFAYQLIKEKKLTKIQRGLEFK